MKGCKNCPAFAKCTVTYRGSACAALRGTYGLDSDPEAITNADKFRAKSDEELAEWLCQALDCDFCKAHMQNIPTHSCCENHESGILKWLQRPAEEEI